MQETESLIRVANRQASIRSLYDKHASTLLGYIFEIVKNQKLAEDYLVKVFCDIAQHFNEIDWDDTNNWCQLKRLAQNKLNQLTDSGRIASDLKDLELQGLVNPESQHQYTDHFTEEQHHIFYNVYYYGKSVEAISKELNKTEESIRKTLKEAFAIMRKSCEN
ncbi:RNA polymerase sigma factor [Pedobacter cryoconitis]|uniref:DNA-directed RNA polymerase specialized sigma24 family protein n=1 Tax=Pedobacter cryoconitis TaxID=188932 RepID=A0A327SUG1_9SPHI|nr:sigma-70 family RNA polymerase sigma factor [Pedobacter cryoconitis]RAJ32966.1 DNA-directed RNA polymerase specialized sigma24 family protein [Pedobacter cryoconitis]